MIGIAPAGLIDKPGSSAKVLKGRRVRACGRHDRRQTGRVSVNHEIPILVILFGALLLVAVLSPLKHPEWLTGEGNRQA